jgi:hypothetical protein
MQVRKKFGTALMNGSWAIVIFEQASSCQMALGADVRMELAGQPLVLKSVDMKSALRKKGEPPSPPAPYAPVCCAFSRLHCCGRLLSVRVRVEMMGLIIIRTG